MRHFSRTASESLARRRDGIASSRPGTAGGRRKQDGLRGPQGLQAPQPAGKPRGFGRGAVCCGQAPARVGAIARSSCTRALAWAPTPHPGGRRRNRSGARPAAWGAQIAQPTLGTARMRLPPLQDAPGGLSSRAACRLLPHPGGSPPGPGSRRCSTAGRTRPRADGTHLTQE